ncbi:hypothetical protein SRHO_G00328280 [Serrasalmus rhombeus]
MQQHSGEKLERALTKVVQKRGLPSAQRDRARVEQLPRGATKSELMLVQLRLRERRSSPPLFLELLNEVREEEDRQLVRRKQTPVAVKATVRQLSATEDIAADLSETARLRTEIDKLKISKLSNEKGNGPQVNGEDNSKQSRKMACVEDRNEVQGIQKQVSDIQHQLQAMAVTFKDTTLKAQRSRPGRELSVRLPSSAQGEQRKESTEMRQRDMFFCYHSGEDGHVARRCMAAEDTSKVVSKLISALKKQKHEEASSVNANNLERRCHVKTSSVCTPKLPGLPEGLVGKSSLSRVIIEGHACTALMDSGSTVTIIFDQWLLMWRSERTCP